MPSLLFGATSPSPAGAGPVARVVSRSMKSHRKYRAVALVAGLCAAGAFCPAWVAAGADPDRQLGLIQALYQEGQSFRAESEVLRFLFENPDHPRRDGVELVRAKLFYRQGRYGESTVMLFSLLDRYPSGKAAPEAGRLLALSLLRQGRLAEAETRLRASGKKGTVLSRLPPPGTVPPERAVAWSTWLPGSGFFLVDQPGVATAAIGLNLFFAGATVAAWQADFRGAALVFLLAEFALYRGGREAAGVAAQRHNAALERAVVEDWAREQGETKILRFAFRF